MSKRNHIRDLTAAAIALALVVIMGTTVLGTIPLPIVEMTIAFLPVMVLSMISTPVYALVVSIGSGVVSMLVCLMMPRSISLDPFIANPLVSILPRVFIGPVCWGVYNGLIKILGKGKEGSVTLSAAAAAAAGSLVNTVGVLLMLWIVYKKELDEVLAYNPDVDGTIQTAGAFLLGVAGTNGIMEMMANLILASAIVTGLKRTVYKS